MTSKLLSSFAALAGVSLLTTASLQGQIYSETGDAGQGSGSAQPTGLVDGGPLSTIVGSFSSPTDADLFLIRLTNPATFSASTVNAFTSLDTALFLFNSAGNAIYTNDDASGSSLASQLPAGSSFTMSLAPGVYYLGVGLSGNDPINAVSQLLFVAIGGGDSTSVRGAAQGVNPSSVADFNGQTAFAEMGSYQIDLTSAATAAAIPEPGSTALFVTGLGALAVAVRRRRKARSAPAVLL